MADAFQDTFYGRMGDVLRDELGRRARLPQPTVDAVAAGCVDRMAEEFGGGQVYLPKFAGRKFKETVAKIVAEFNGTNYAQLAKKYDRSERRIRQIVEEHSRPEKPRAEKPGA